MKDLINKGFISSEECQHAYETHDFNPPDISLSTEMIISLAGQIRCVAKVPLSLEALPNIPGCYKIPLKFIDSVQREPNFPELERYIAYIDKQSVDTLLETTRLPTISQFQQQVLISSSGSTSSSSSGNYLPQYTGSTTNKTLSTSSGVSL